MKTIILSLGFIALALGATAQVKIKDGSVSGTSTVPNSTAILDLESSNKGLHIPRVSLQATNNPAPLNGETIATGFSAKDSGLVVYNLATAGTAPYNVSPGLYYCDGTQWVAAATLKAVGAAFWAQNGNNWGSATQPGVLGLLSNAANKGLNIQADSVTVGASTDTVNGFTKFQVRGASTNTVAYNAGSSLSIDFTRSNLAYTTASAGAFTITGMKDGGTYTLAVQGTTQGTAAFAQTGLTFRPANGNGATLIGYQTVYTFIVMGTTVYFWMTTGI